MTTSRQDAWTQDEDLMLAEVVLRHIREGSTQLAAFEEVGKKLSRTAAACGFRWNSAIRKQYNSAIEFAKKQRKGVEIEVEVQKSEVPESKKQKNVKAETKKDVADVASLNINHISFETVREFLTTVELDVKKLIDLERENSTIKNKLKKLQEEKQEQSRELESWKENYKLIEEDYKALIQIMERARKMIVLQEDDGSKFRFQMDKNGNLERVNK
ncbi:RsfA family transcriptional regulator [Bacillus sp. Marseille-P3661]|uniref:RsfA family transcriptional regulator n=1 Tax=Bacillus sp. Marseille-P3661 TaxID=1936234 RepID=UPI000C817B86|nr:RsfA family transcriptional regulator [Bacillus sp. Marseille-P3661]